MTVTAEGILRGLSVELDRETGLPDGVRVRVVLEPALDALPDRQAQFAALAGICRDDPSFFEAMEQIERDRRQDKP